MELSKRIYNFKIHIYITQRCSRTPRIPFQSKTTTHEPCPVIGEVRTSSYPRQVLLTNFIHITGRGSIQTLRGFRTADEEVVSGLSDFLDDLADRDHGNCTNDEAGYEEAEVLNPL